MKIETIIRRARVQDVGWMDGRTCIGKSPKEVKIRNIINMRDPSSTGAISPYPTDRKAFRADRKAASMKDEKQQARMDGKQQA